ncbi:GNAT family N-acetyltransferase [Actinoplanes sp. NPDC048796]|uniref:GNAT family N-acetyltransferase n=1 Tax=unclassified Actinoplanes TaxID=2626549 RepID=UPI00341163BD
MTNIVDAVAEWQHTGGPVQLHPGDLGWAWRFGPPAVRTWTDGGRVLAAGLADHGDDLIRMGIAPAVADDTAFAARLLADLSDPAQGTPPATVEARFGPAFRALLERRGWTADEPWTPLSRDLTEPVEDCGLRIEVVGPGHVEDRVAVQRASFPNSTFTVERWHTMAAAPPYRQARCLVAYDTEGTPVATVTVWSAGEGRPGLIEPLGVHRDHRGHGYGRAITVAAAVALREMGSSTATVCTPSANVGAVAAYASAGLEKHPAVTDFRRPAGPAV